MSSFSPRKILYDRHKEIISQHIQELQKSPSTKAQLQLHFEELLKDIHFFERPDIFPSPGRQQTSFPSQYCRDKERQLEESVGYIENLERELELLRKENNQLLRERSLYSDLLDRNRKLEEEIYAIQKYPKKALKNLEKLEEENNRLEDKFFEIKTKADDYDMIKSELEITQKAYQELKDSYYNDATTLYEEIDELKQNNRRLEVLLIGRDRQISELETKIKFLQGTETKNTPPKAPKKTTSVKKVRQNRLNVRKHSERLASNNSMCQTCVNLHKHRWAIN